MINNTSGASREAVNWIEIRNARLAQELGATRVTEDQIVEYIRKQLTGGRW
jgi:hypothetical protein